MRKFLGCCSILLLVSCLDETRVDPATPSTFVRYINGGNHDRAVALEKTDNHGYIILANSELKITDANKISEKIKLVKVNQYGSVLWSKVIPETSETQDDVRASYHANGIFVSDKGYIIAGETIQNGGKKQLLIVQTDLEGGSVQQYTVDGLTTDEVVDGGGTVVGDVSGVAVTKAKANDKLLVLSSVVFTGVVNSIPGNMILAEVVPPSTTTPGSLPTVTWDYRYGSSASTLFNQMFIDSVSAEVIFGGTVTVTGVASQTDLRLVKAVQNSQGTTFDLNFGEPDRSERANGICRTRNGFFAMVGSTDVANKTDRDIMFSRFSSTGAVLSTRTYPVYYPGTADPRIDVKKDEEGNDVCNTADNGFIILGTMQEAKEKVGDVDLVLGRGERDFYLMKVNAFGDIEWERSFGSRRDDLGVAVTQAEDGGYLILGSTNLANLWTITLIKTNSLGEIE